MRINIDDHAQLVGLLEGFLAADTAARAHVTLPPTPSLALGEALARRDRAAVSVCRLLTGRGGAR